MTVSPSPTDVVVAFIRAVEQRDLDVALSMVSDEVEYDNVPIGKVVGPEGIRRVLTSGMLATADRLEEIVRQAADVESVFNERRDRFRLGGHWIEVPVVGVFVVRAGRITLWRDYFDLPSVVAQLAPAGDAPGADGSGT